MESSYYIVCDDCGNEYPDWMKECDMCKKDKKRKKPKNEYPDWGWVD